MRVRGWKLKEECTIQVRKGQRMWKVHQFWEREREWERGKRDGTLDFHDGSWAVTHVLREWIVINSPWDQTKLLSIWPVCRLNVRTRPYVSVALMYSSLQPMLNRLSWCQVALSVAHCPRGMPLCFKVRFTSMGSLN